MVRLDPKKRAGIEIALFVVVTYGLNYAMLHLVQSNFLLFGVREFIRKWGVLLQMWIPGISAVIFRLIFQRGFKDVGWKLGNRMFWWLSILIPFSVPVVSFLVALFIDNVHINRINIANYVYRDPVNLLTLYWPAWFTNSLGLELLARSIIVLTVGLLINFVLAFGEELGWRGYLQQRIIDTEFKYPYALCGLIWAGWHFPFLWYGNCSDPQRQSREEIWNISLLS